MKMIGKVQRKKQRIYVTAANNADHWRGYLPGTTRAGFVIIVRTVYDTKKDENYDLVGRIKTPGGSVTVSKLDSNDFWEID